MNRLSEDVIVNIVQFISPLDLIFLQQTCKSLLQLCPRKLEAFWKKKYLKHFEEESLAAFPDDTWHDRYVKRKQVYLNWAKKRFNHRVIRLSISTGYDLYDYAHMQIVGDHLICDMDYDNNNIHIDLKLGKILTVDHVKGDLYMQNKKTYLSMTWPRLQVIVSGDDMRVTSAARTHVKVFSIEEKTSLVDSFFIPTNMDVIYIDPYGQYFITCTGCVWTTHNENNGKCDAEIALFCLKTQRKLNSWKYKEFFPKHGCHYCESWQHDKFIVNLTTNKLYVNKSVDYGSWSKGIVACYDLTSKEKVWERYVICKDRSVDLYADWKNNRIWVGDSDDLLVYLALEEKHRMNKCMFSIIDATSGDLLCLTDFNLIPCSDNWLATFNRENSIDLFRNHPKCLDVGERPIKICDTGWLNLEKAAPLSITQSWQYIVWQEQREDGPVILHVLDFL
jgi:hypothetical protein